MDHRQAGRYWDANADAPFALGSGMFTATHCSKSTGARRKSRCNSLPSGCLGCLVVLVTLVAGLTPARAQDCVGPIPGPRTLFKFGKAIFVGTAIKQDQQSGYHTFLVTEAFKGVAGKYIDVVEFPGGMPFELGKQYLVFADPCPFEPGNRRCLTSFPCSGTRALEYAHAVIKQLRAEKSGRGVASVYGMLWRTMERNEGIWEDGNDRPLAKVVVRLRSGNKSLETKTDEHGVYAFQRLPKGTYEVSADLPPGLAAAQMILKDPPPPFELPSRSSFEYDIYVRPTGRISGSVIGPEGQPLRSAQVDLYQLNRYREGKPGLWSIQGQNRPAERWKPFEFQHLPPGDYVLVFNSANSEQADGPFPRTFYPHAADLAGCQVIHLAAGQTLNADIHVRADTRPKRQITVRLAWGNRLPEQFSPPQVIVEASTGMRPYPFPGHDSYTLNLLLNARYTIHAQAYCRTSIEKAETNTVTVDGGDPSVSEITLTFDKGGCTRK